MNNKYMNFIYLDTELDVTQPRKDEKNSFFNSIVSEKVTDNRKNFIINISKKVTDNRKNFNTVKLQTCYGSLLCNVVLFVEL